MDIYVVDSRDELSKLGSIDGEAVRLCFRPTEVEVLSLIKNINNIKILCVPESYFKTMSKTIVDILKLSNVVFIGGNIKNDKMKLHTYYHMFGDSFKLIKLV